MCAKMKKLIDQHRAPPGAIAPIPLPRDGLLDLAVDDPIWLDVGLDDLDADGNPTPVPRWLADEKVRIGIRGLLQLDRCLEEEERLIEERATFQEWAAAEWDAISAASRRAGKLCIPSS